MKIMTFRLADQTYGVDLSHVAGVQRADAAVEPASAGVDGSPLDLSRHLGHDVGPGQAGTVIVLQAQGRRVALRVDAPGEVLEVDAGKLLDVPRFFDTSLVRAVVEIDERLVVLLDEEALVREARGASAATHTPYGGEP